MIQRLRRVCDVMVMQIGGGDSYVLIWTCCMNSLGILGIFFFIQVYQKWKSLLMLMKNSKRTKHVV